MDTAVLISCLALVGTLLIVLLLLCRLVQPYDIAWFLSNREDKLNLSKMRLYNANGYLMHSGSEILLGSTGSFRRFDSVDRDYKPQYHGSGTVAGGAVVVPPWRHSHDEPDTIPPQPLRPAPSPREAKLSREKPIHRQTSEPKPASQSIVISPIPRPVPRKQHSAPISFPLPLLAGSPREKRKPIVTTTTTTTTTSTNPFVVVGAGGSSGALREEDPLCEESPAAAAVTTTTTTTVRARPHPAPLPAAVGGSPVRPPAPHTDGVSVFRSALKSANNPFLLDSPPTLAANNRHNQQTNNQQQQQQQQTCVFNFDPAMVHSLFNRPVPGLGTVDRPPAPVPSAAQQHQFSSLTATPPPPPPAAAQSVTTSATTTTTTNTCEEDPLRRAEKRLSKMENLRKMSRLIESNQLLLNIYQQFNRTITEPTGPAAGTGARPTVRHPASPPPSPSPPSQASQAGCESSPSPSGTDAGRGNRYHDSPRTDALDCIRVPTVSRSIKHILRNRSFSETEFSERTLIKSFALLSDPPDGQQPGTPDGPLHRAPSSPSPSCTHVTHASQRDLSRGYAAVAGGSGSGSGSGVGTGSGTTTTGSGRPFRPGSTETLHKTVSESFLGQYFSFGSERYRSATVLPSSSCESVASQSSVVFADLVHPDRSPTQPVAGYLCVALQPDPKNGNTGTGTGTGKQGMELAVTVQEAKDLVGVPVTTDPAPETETLVRVLLAADESQTVRQTKVCRGTAVDRASFHETFTFSIATGTGERQTLAFQVFQSAGGDSSGSLTLIGEAELQLTDAIQRPLTTWLKLNDSRYRRPDLGELMFSLSYLPTAERLTVVVVKARNLALKAPRHPALSNGRRDSQCEESLAEPSPPVVASTADHPDTGGSVFVKVYLLQNDQKVSKKKTSVRRAERFPIYNEAIIFSVPPYLLNTVQIRLSVVQMLNRSEVVANGPVLDGAGEPMLGGRRKSSIKLVSLGHVIIGSGTTGKALRHWHQMLTALRKPVAMWHGLRSSSERGKSVAVTGNVVASAKDTPDTDQTPKEPPGE